MQDNSKNLLQKKTKIIPKQTHATKLARRDKPIQQPEVVCRSGYAANREIAARDAARLRQYQVFYNNRPLSLCLDKRYFPNQDYFSKQDSITKEECFPDLATLFPAYIIAPKPLPVDEPSDLSLFDNLLDDVRHAKDSNYRSLLAVTEFWEDIRICLREDFSSLKSTFEGGAGIGLGIILDDLVNSDDSDDSDLTSKGPRLTRIELKRDLSPPVHSFGDPAYLQEVRDHLIRRNQREVLEMSGDKHPLRVQSFKPPTRESERAFEQGRGIWTMKGRLQALLD